MADNVQALLAGVLRLFRTTDVGGVHTPHHIAERDPADPMLDLLVRVGAAVLSPDPFSVLSRLKNIEGYVDGLEAPTTAIKNAVESLNPVQIYTSNSYNNITTKTTTAIKAGAGTLERIVINKTGSADTITIYDSLAGSGTLIGTITAPTVGMNLVYNCSFGTGLTIVTGGTTAGDYTVTYR